MSAPVPVPVRLPAQPTLKPRGNALARWVLSVLGWRVVFDGFPARQGVILVYPHTSNWDFPLGVLVKWAIGLETHWWGKDSLFRIPVLGAWMRSIGGIPVDRGNRSGLVANTAEQLRRAMQADTPWWLAAAPEGTRSLSTGWRSGGYQLAVQARAPIALVAFDFATRTVRLTDFVMPCGDPDQDFACFAEVFRGVKGYRPELASPIRLKS